MIQVKHIVNFPDHIKLSSLAADVQLAEILKVQESCRIEAVSRGCIYFKDVVEADNSLVITFIWATKDESEVFVKWANDTHDYDNMYIKFVNRIRDLGGNVTREETALMD
jgi:hypothetical protein